MSDALQRMLDKSEIQDVLLRYARGTDRRDKELVRQAYFEDATDEHGDFKGTRDEFVAWWYPRNAQTAKVVHLLGNCLIEFASDTVAVVETYFVSTAELSASADGPRKMLLSESSANNGQALKIEVYGRYVDRFEKRNGEWRIAKRRVVFDASDTKPISGAASPTGILGRRDPQDTIYLVRAEAGLR